MHAFKITVFIVLGVWLYAVIGARFGRSFIEEVRGLKGDNWPNRLLILLLWPILVIAQYFEE